MTFSDLVVLYEKKKVKLGSETYKHISELLREAKELHKKRLGEKSYRKWRS